MNAVCFNNLQRLDLWPEFEKANLRRQVITYLSRLEKTPLTFTLNQLQGTPSFIVFNKSYDVLYQSFGHVEYEEIANNIAQFN